MIGQKAPQFRGIALTNGKFKEISLTDFKGTMVILFFYPMDFAAVCTTEIIAFSKHFWQFKAINCAVIGCSSDTEYSHLAWTQLNRKSGGLGIVHMPLLCDRSGAIARAYGVRNDELGITNRALFIIDKYQVIRQVWISVLPVARSIEETLRLAQAIQMTDMYGKMCPANWRPGDRMLPNIYKHLK